MNKAAKELGLSNTKYVNPHGTLNYFIKLKH